VQNVIPPVQRAVLQSAALLGYMFLAGLQLGGPTPARLTALAALTLTALLVALLTSRARIAAAATAIPLGSRAAALREKSWRADFLPQRDPDSAGRPRPRAPSAVLAAA
jgi:hypothetical protein